VSSPLAVVAPMAVSGCLFGRGTSVDLPKSRVHLSNSE
jgi:hypothetical protein